MMSETALRTAQSNLGTVTLYCGQTERSCQDLKRQKLSHDSVILMPETWDSYLPSHGSRDLLLPLLFDMQLE